MTSTQFIGELTANYLFGEVRAASASERSSATARYIIDCLHSEQMAAIARAIHSRPELSARIEVKLPEHLLQHEGLPQEFLTRERATYYRHAAIEKPALLVANTGDDEEQSLRELLPVGTRELRERTNLWVEKAAEDLDGILGDQDKKIWAKALEAFSDQAVGSLDELARYTLRVRRHMKQDGQPLLSALGMALPELRVPRNSTIFHGIPAKKRRQKWPWMRKIRSLLTMQEPLLRKQTSDGRTLTAKVLQTTFDEVRADIPEAYHQTMQAFINAPAGWNAQAAALAEQEWVDVQRLFGSMRRAKRFDFRKRTHEFYAERKEWGLLTEDEEEYLRLLEKSRRTSAEEEDQEFFDNHRRELAEEPKLFAAWEKFVYQSPIESRDFVRGLALALEPLAQEGISDPGKITIHSDRQSQKDFESLNKEAARYFACRYRGLEALLESWARLQVGHLFRYHELEQDWKNKGIKYGRSRSRRALQLRFEVRIRRGDEVARKRLVWTFKKDSIEGQLPSDLRRLKKRVFSALVASREPVRSKASAANVDLQDRGTLVAAFGQQRGTLVATDPEDLAATWRRNLDLAVAERVLVQSTRNRLEALFGEFEQRYTAALRGFSDHGFEYSEDIEQQATAFGALLACVCQEAPGDRNRELLLRPLMRIGIAQVNAGQAVAIVAPWQPLRLAAMVRKARFLVRLLERVGKGGDMKFGDRRLYFQDVAQVLEDPFYPEVVAGWQGRKPQLLKHCDTAGDYTLHDLPVAKSDNADEDAKGAARQVTELVGRFLKLYPHERADLSVALFNPSTARWVRTVVDTLESSLGKERDIRCRLILWNRDRRQLAKIYQDLVEDSESDEFMTTDGSRDFMSWLRVEVWHRKKQEDEIRPVDLLFAQDAISQHATVQWRYLSPEPIAPQELVPPHWARRVPAERGMLRSAVYLTCPQQTSEGWAYLDAVAALILGERSEANGQRLVPVVELKFQDDQTRRIIQDTHGLANWVANYDRLLDRSHLESQDIRIIRWKRIAAQGRSLLVSSNAETELLRKLVAERLKRLGLPFAGDGRRLKDLALRMIEDASKVSGDILLRAAKRGRSASELIGLVLSRYEVQRKLGVERTAGWYFLDDYAARLGQREGQIADILALSPHRGEDDVWELDVFVSEAKYIVASGLASKRRESQRQLLQTMERLHGALDEESPRVDRGLWRARLSDLILDRVIDAVGSAEQSASLRRAIRSGSCRVTLRGASHVFVWGPSEAQGCGADAPVGNQASFEATQTIYDPVQLRDLVAAYEREKGGGNAPLPNGRVVTERNGGTGNGEEPDKDGPKPDPPLPPPAGNAFAHLIEKLEGPAPEENAVEDDAQLKATERALKGALSAFGFSYKVERSRATPNTVLVDFRGTASLTVSKVRSRQSELLTTYGLRVVSVQGKPGIVSIAVARKRRKTVRLQDLWKTWHPALEGGNTELLIGVREDNGEAQMLHPGGRHAPHTLIAGATGSGKSVLMQNILLAIGATNTPQQAHITLVDPKHGVDYFAFDDLPHLEGGVIVAQDKALERIDSLVEEMDRRYALLREARAKDLRAFNRKMSTDQQLPVLWLVHDEFAEWMLTESYKKSVTSAVARLGVKARAAGIHLVFASQRPDANVTPPQLRDNLGNRLILRVNSEGTSKMALDSRDAVQLLGRGHMLAKLDGEDSLVYVQVPYMEPETIECAVQAIKECHKQSAMPDSR